MAVSCIGVLHTILKWLISTNLKWKSERKNVMSVAICHVAIIIYIWTVCPPGDPGRSLVSQNSSHYDGLNKGWESAAQSTQKETLLLGICGPSSCCHLIWAGSLPINIPPTLTPSQTLGKQIIQLYRWQKMRQSGASSVYSVSYSSTLSSLTAHMSDCQGNKIWRSQGQLMKNKSCLLISPAEKFLAKSRIIFSSTSLQIW